MTVTLKTFLTLRFVAVASSLSTPLIASGTKEHTQNFVTVPGNQHDAGHYMGTDDLLTSSNLFESMRRLKNNNESKDYKNEDYKSENTIETLAPSSAPTEKVTLKQVLEESATTETRNKKENVVELPPFMMQLDFPHELTTPIDDVSIRELTRTFLMFRFEEEFGEDHDFNFIALDIFNSTRRATPALEATTIHSPHLNNGLRHRHLANDEVSDEVLTAERIFMGNAYFYNSDPGKDVISEVTLNSFLGTREEIFLELMKISDDEVLRNVRKVTVMSLESLELKRQSEAADAANNSSGNVFFDRTFLYVWIGIGLAGIAFVCGLLYIVNKRNNRNAQYWSKNVGNPSGSKSRGRASAEYKIPTSIKPNSTRNFDTMSDIAMSDLNSITSGRTNGLGLGLPAQHDEYTVGSGKYDYSLAGGYARSMNAESAVKNNGTFDNTDSDSDSNTMEESLQDDGGHVDDGASSAVDSYSNIASGGMSVTDDMSAITDNRFNSVLGFESYHSTKKAPWSNQVLAQRMSTLLKENSEELSIQRGESEDIEVQYDPNLRRANNDDNDDKESCCSGDDDTTSYEELGMGLRGTADI
mmetsp:Transcript_44909/g.54405  ORF Transcript_44909/g.54405 Transcript_44909/m.54405 type:complete len:585 (+) Transcript_44909:95-1849(+)|eukprot:CAMPEP_0172493360 /NCGR_PEP_ID=MMETSP1066-20121228/24784_1 /TAXON_ID=671091 /ORGANISM="Coscinodiscus wailesii, Strain CCMP2513" /LENGTH=584 /DNA_ID=CAMNT_0013263497 /DNA_START=94 /DNA_END=1848 /DNA_ORIENTATION=-